LQIRVLLVQGLELQLQGVLVCVRSQQPLLLLLQMQLACLQHRVKLLG